MHIPLLIDPLALLLREDIYVRLHLPDPAPELEKQVAAFLKTASAEDKARFTKQAAVYASYFASVQKAIREAG